MSPFLVEMGIRVNETSFMRTNECPLLSSESTFAWVWGTGFDAQERLVEHRKPANAVEVAAECPLILTDETGELDDKSHSPLSTLWPNHDRRNSDRNRLFSDLVFRS